MQNKKKTQHSYSTGYTRPPKNHGGLIAFLLVSLIFFSGLVSAMGMMNIDIFVPQETVPAPAFTPMSFSATFSTTPPEAFAEPVRRGDELILNCSPASAPNVTQEGGLSLQEIYRKNIASVVSIECLGDSGTVTGTGVIFDEDGYIVTNAHVVSDAWSIHVTLSDQSHYNATVVGQDLVCDLAVLYIAAQNLTPAEFGDSSMLEVGDSVAAIGDPMGMELRGTMTPGIISGIDRDVSVDGYAMTLIQTNAALNPGNSGGPLLNCYGQVIGINTLKLTDDLSGIEGIGFAIPSTTVKEVVDALLCQGFIPGKPSLGLTGQMVTDFEHRYYQLPYGLYITQVSHGTDASYQGVCPGDILVSFCGQPVTDLLALETAILAYFPGDCVTVEIYRDGVVFPLELVLTDAR